MPKVKSDPVPPPALPPGATKEEKKAHDKAFNAYLRKMDKIHEKTHKHEETEDDKRAAAKKARNAELKKVKAEAKAESHAEDQKKREDMKAFHERGAMMMEDRNVSLKRQHEGTKWVDHAIQGSIV